MLSPADKALALSSPLGLATVASGGTYLSAPHLELLNTTLLKVARREIRRLMIFMPPQHGKSTITSHYFADWWMGTFPDEPVLLASYGQSWAEHWGREARSTMEEYGAALWGLNVRQDSRASGRWQLEGHRGGMTAVGIGGSLTGRGAGLLLIDDPVKDADEARSPVIQQRNNDWHQSVARTRLAQDGCEVLIMTRWNEGDIAGQLLAAEGHAWTVLSLPAIAEEHDALGREPGEALWPAKFSREYLDEVRYGVVDPETQERRGGTSAYWFGAMYQQRPSPEEGGLFKRAWWRFYDVDRPPEDLGYGATFVDTAQDDKESGDYCALATWQTRGLDFYLTRLVREHLQFPDLLQACVNAQQASETPRLPNGLPVVVEETPWSKPLIHSLQRLVKGVLAFKIEGRSKWARASAVSPFVESGNCYLPGRRDANGNWRPASPLIADFIEEHASFPNGAHDDMVDTTSMMGLRLGVGGAGRGAPQIQAITYVKPPPDGRTPTLRERHEARQAPKGGMKMPMGTKR